MTAASTATEIPAFEIVAIQLGRGEKVHALNPHRTDGKTLACGSAKVWGLQQSRTGVDDAPAVTCSKCSKNLVSAKWHTREAWFAAFLAECEAKKSA